MNALQEPAILHLIFEELSQLDLIRVKSICRTWRATVIDSTELLSLLWLHPGHEEPCRPRETGLNPLLEEAFPSFFRGTTKANGYTYGHGNAGPWADLAGYLAFDACSNNPKERERQAKFMRPEASWRRMIPCWPPPTELLINMLYDHTHESKLLRRRFSNTSQEHSPAGRPPWLTFGLIHDIVENAWFQHKPHYADFVELHFLHINPRGTVPWPLIPRDAFVSPEFRQSSLPRAGRISVNLHMSSAPETERIQLHKTAYTRQVQRYEYQRNRIRLFEPCGTKAGRPRPPYIFAKEFHFEDALSLEDVEWDEVQEYTVPQRPPPNIQATKKKSLLRSCGSSLWQGFCIMLVLLYKGVIGIYGGVKWLWK